jgi:hypothetical protein
MFTYQRVVFFPGLAFLAVVLAGLAGVLRKWRSWGGPGVLPWAVAAISIVLPPMLTWYAYRYALAAVPLSCMAAGLAFARTSSWLQPAAARGAAALPAGGRTPETGSSGKEEPTDTEPARAGSSSSADEEHAAAAKPPGGPDSPQSVHDPGSGP